MSVRTRASSSKRTQPEEMEDTEAHVAAPVSSSQQQIMVIPQWEKSVRRFTGQSGHNDLVVWLEDIESAWRQRPNQSDPERAAYLWSHLGTDVREELSCQGVDRRDKDAILEALQETYGDSRSLSSLSLAFHTTRQEGYEGVRQFSTRLHAAFVDLNRQHRRLNIAQVDEACLKSQFVEGIRDEHLKLNIRQHSIANPNATFQDLRKTVLSWKPEREGAATCSGIKSEVQGQTSSLEAKIHELFIEQNKVLAAQAESLRQQAEKVDCLTRTVETLQKQKNEAENRRGETTNKKEDGSMSGQPKSSLSDNRACHYCGKLGHFVAECRKKKRDREQQGQVRLAPRYEAGNSGLQQRRV